MINRLFITVLIILFAVDGFGQQKDSAVIREIQQLEKKRFDAQVNKDISFLEKVFADDLVYVHSNGKIHNKAQFIEFIKDSANPYKKITEDEKQYRIYNNGKTIVINGSVFITFPQVSEKPNIGHLYYTVVYIKNKNDWKLVSWQSVRLPE